MRLVITADVKARPDSLLDFTYAPYSLQFKKNKADKLEEMRVQFTNRGQKEYRLKVIDYPARLLQVRFSRETLMPGKTVELRVIPAKAFPPKMLKKSITVQAGSEKVFRLTIPVTIEGG